MQISSNRAVMRWIAIVVMRFWFIGLGTNSTKLFAYHIWLVSRPRLIRGIIPLCSVIGYAIVGHVETLRISCCIAFMVIYCNHDTDYTS